MRNEPREVGEVVRLREDLVARAVETHEVAHAERAAAQIGEAVEEPAVTLARRARIGDDEQHGRIRDGIGACGDLCGRSAVDRCIRGAFDRERERRGGEADVDHGHAVRIVHLRDGGAGGHGLRALVDGDDARGALREQPAVELHELVDIGAALAHGDAELREQLGRDVAAGISHDRAGRYRHAICRHGYFQYLLMVWSRSGPTVMIETRTPASCSRKSM